ncbi:hypothetical protein ADL25_21970 [Streptomyces sp. NRRL F-5122]|nr:hypothetical protein ADL25_21970 [Streptomyces sp. NRRL F-5122]
MTPEVLRVWLDAAHAHRPRSHRSAEESFALSLGQVARQLVLLASGTGQPWNHLLSHRVFVWPVITTPELRQPVPLEPGPPVSVQPGYGCPQPATPGPALEVLAFAVTVGLVPFLQTIATQAAQRTFDAARAAFRERLGRGEARVSGPYLVIEERDGRVEFRVPSGIPDAALEALVALGDQGLERLAKADPKGRAVTVTWNAGSGRWERAVSQR